VRTACGRLNDASGDRNGAAQTVVIDVGGFLGFGKKDIAVPFSGMQWCTEGRKIPATDQPLTNPVASTTGTSGQQPSMKETDPVACAAARGAATVQRTIGRGTRALIMPIYGHKVV
jgi:hypothetical protein